MTNLAEEITTAVLGVLKRGGDNYNIYVAVKAALAAAPAVGGEAITKALNAFSDFINEPPQYEDKRMVRDYRHELARKWVPLFEAIQAAMATPAAPAAPPASPLRGREPTKEATQAQHFDRPKGKPAQFVRNGILETCQCLMCLAEKSR